jgi:hypothetical protein
VIAAIRQTQLDAGVAKNLVYDRTLYIMAVLLLLGLICNALVKPVKASKFMTDEELAHERSLQHEAPHVSAGTELSARGAFGITGTLAWLAVGVPFLIGLYIALVKAAALF